MALAFTGHLISLRKHIYGLQDHLKRAAQNPVTLQMEEIMTQADQLKADHAYISCIFGYLVDWWCTLYDWSQFSPQREHC